VASEPVCNSLLRRDLWVWLDSVAAWRNHERDPAVGIHGGTDDMVYLRIQWA
jgi:hypothetical protein